MRKLSIESLQLEVKQSLESTKTCEVVAVQSRGGDLRAMFRVKDRPKWMRLLSDILGNTADVSWYLFLGEKYFLHEGKLVTAWVVTLGTADNELKGLLAAVNEFRTAILDALDRLERVLTPAPPPPVAVATTTELAQEDAAVIDAPLPWPMLGKSALSRVRPVRPGR